MSDPPKAPKLKDLSPEVQAQIRTYVHLRDSLMDTSTNNAPEAPEATEAPDATEAPEATDPPEGPDSPDIGNGNSISPPSSANATASGTSIGFDIDSDCTSLPDMPDDEDTFFVSPNPSSCTLFEPGPSPDILSTEEGTKLPASVPPTGNDGPSEEQTPSPEVEVEVKKSARSIFREIFTPKNIFGPFRAGKKGRLTAAIKYPINIIRRNKQDAFKIMTRRTSSRDLPYHVNFTFKYHPPNLAMSRPSKYDYKDRNYSRPWAEGPPMTPEAALSKASVMVLNRTSPCGSVTSVDTLPSVSSSEDLFEKDQIEDLSLVDSYVVPKHTYEVLNRSLHLSLYENENDSTNSTEMKCIFKKNGNNSKSSKKREPSTGRTSKLEKNSIGNINRDLPYMRPTAISSHRASLSKCTIATPTASNALKCRLSTAKSGTTKPKPTAMAKNVVPPGTANVLNVPKPLNKPATTGRTGAPPSPGRPPAMVKKIPIIKREPLKAKPKKGESESPTNLTSILKGKLTAVPIFDLAFIQAAVNKATATVVKNRVSFAPAPKVEKIENSPRPAPKLQKIENSPKPAPKVQKIENSPRPIVPKPEKIEDSPTPSRKVEKVESSPRPPLKVEKVESSPTATPKARKAPGSFHISPYVPDPVTLQLLQPHSSSAQEKTESNAKPKSERTQKKKSDPSHSHKKKPPDPGPSTD